MNGRRQHYAVTACVVVGLVVVTWGRHSVPSQPGLDPSWNAALNMGVVHGLAWGRDLVFTYGPLGFLATRGYWYAGTWTLALVYGFASQLALLGLLWSGARRSFGVVIGTLVIFVVAAYLGDAPPAIAFAAAVWALRPGARSRRQVVAFAVALGLYTGMQLLIKLNYGVTILVLALVALIAMPQAPRRREAIGAYLGATGAGALALWFAAGQPLGALPDYVHASISVASGYSSALSLGTPSLNWQYPAFAVVCVAGLAAIVLATRPWPRRSRIGVVVLWAVVAFAFFKEGFIRHDLSHSVIPFGVFLAALLVVPWDRSRRLRVAGLVVVALPFLVITHSLRPGLGDIVSPVTRAENAWHDVETAFSPGRRHALERQGRTQIAAAEPLPARVRSAVRGQSVWVAPFEEAVAWAYRLRWRPVPTFQTYQVDTRYLDSQGARRLSGKHAPERILLGPGPPTPEIITTWQPPQTLWEMVCRYRKLIGGSQWSVLARGRNRCGRTHLVRTVRATLDEPVRVPRPRTRHAIVSVRIHGLELRGVELARAAVFKPLPRYITFDRVRSSVLVPYAARGPIVLDARAIPGYGTLAPNPGVISVLITGREKRRVRYDFYETPTAG